MKKIIFTLMFAFLSCFLISCQTSGNKPKFNYPTDIKTICENARNDAIACINGKGENVKAEKPIVLRKRENCVKKYGVWAWREPSLNNIWVVGATWKKGDGYYIEVACNPNTMGDVDYQTLQHEHGHYLLWSNYNDPRHNPKYKSCFRNWSDPKVKSMTIELDDQKVIFDYIPEK